MNIEGLIIKYSLGIGFVVITLVFGIKIVLLLTTVAKIKIAAWSAAHSWSQVLLEGIKNALEGGK